MKLAMLIAMAVLLAGCAGRPMRAVAKHAGSIEIATAEAGELASHRVDKPTKVAVGSAAGTGAAAGLVCGPMAVVCSPVWGLSMAVATYATITIPEKLERLGTKQSRAAMEHLLHDVQPEGFIADVAGIVRQRIGQPASPPPDPAVQVVLAVSRLELRPAFPSRAQLVVWIEAQAQLVDARGRPRDAWQRYVHEGDIVSLRNLEQHPEVLSREVDFAKQDLARRIGEELKR